MDSDSRNVDNHNTAPTKVGKGPKSRHNTQAIAALCSLLLVLVSLLFISIRTHTTSAASPNSITFRKSTVTPTLTSTATATITITPTATNTPVPTATRAPTATATQTITPTATTPKPTPTIGTTPTKAVATSTPKAKLTPGTTPTVSIVQSPTTTTANVSESGDTIHNPSSTTPQSNWLSLSTVTIGLLVVLSIASTFLITLVILRNTLMPTTSPNAKLPPSGAQPWKRVRTDSLDGTAYNQHDS